MNSDLGRFTVKGSPVIEKKILEMIRIIAESMTSAIKKEKYKALVLLGGYGRGEGGVLIENGKEKPHNNFDFILITENLNEHDQYQLKTKIDELMISIEEKIDLVIDFNIISRSKLTNSPCRMIWYDMRFGHKTILGDKNFVPSLKSFSKKRIPNWEARNLIVNRGTLMIINELILEKEPITENYKKLVIKHAIKAIIAYGDALLFFLGDYSWSYVERQKKMSARDDIDQTFKKLYDEAMEFRFKPDYKLYLKKDLKLWIKTLQNNFNKIHLFCESKRLRINDLNWKNYTEHAFKHAFFEEIISLRTIAKKVINLSKSNAYPGKGGVLTSLGFRTSGKEGILPILFPLIAYHLSINEFKTIGKKILNSDGTDISSLRIAYLKEWGRYGDLKKYGVSLNSLETDK